MKKLTTAYNDIYKSILTINPVFNYDQLAQKFIDLSTLISALPDDNDSWYYIGEFNESDLMNTVIGAYWHYSQWHSGQNSISYAALCALVSIYTPNMECEPSNPDDSGYDAFEQLEQLAKVNQVKTTIGKQWDEMLSRGIMPLFELEIINDEYLLVELSIVDKGIEFVFDSDNKPVSFDEEIVLIHDNRYLLPFDDNDNLDRNLEIIMQNLNEGYLLPNNLDRNEG
tara:strand:+ start:843 stop:1520 length:678 start_codon:yes stop_codon:yes gene_type:complete